MIKEILINSSSYRPASSEAGNGKKINYNSMEKPMRKNAKKYLGLILMFLVGLSILLYPTVSNIWNQYRDSLLISKYDSVVSSDIESDQNAEMWKAAEEYNKQIKQESVPDAFSVRDGQTDPVYESLLNLNGDGMMGYVEVPVIGQSIPIYHYTTEESLEKGAGHLFGSSLPVGGESTHCIISAHRGLPSAKLFTDLNLVETGDVFYLHVLGQTLAYEADLIQTVLPEETSSLAITEGEDYVTLITCTPYAVNTHRILVRGHRIPYEEAKEIEKTEKKVPVLANPSKVMLALCIVIGIVIAVVIVTIVNRVGDKKNRKKKRDKK